MADPTVTPMFNVPIPESNRRIPGITPDQKYVEEDGKHRGVAGFTRDVLGTLGDFLLTRLHMPAMYGPAQQRRKLAAAQQGIDDDPIGAIQRVTSIDPVFGAKLRDQVIDNQRLAAAQAQTTEDRAVRLQIAQQARNDKTLDIAGRMLGSTVNWTDADKANKWPVLRQHIVDYGKANGYDFSSELPSGYDQDVVDSYINGGISGQAQRSLRQAGEKAQATQDYNNRNLNERVRHNQATESVAQEGLDVRREGQRLSHEDRVLGQTVRERIATMRDQTSRRNQDVRTASRNPPRPRADAGAIGWLRKYAGTADEQAARDKFDGRFGVGMADRVLGKK